MNRTMRNWDHAGDALKVVGLNGLAIITSFQTDLEWWLRCGALALTSFYTVIKIRGHFRQPKGKPDERDAT